MTYFLRLLLKMFRHMLKLIQTGNSPLQRLNPAKSPVSTHSQGDSTTDDGLRG